MVQRSSLAENAESRWPAILALVGVLALVTALPSRYAFLPNWVPWTLGGIVLASMVTVTLWPTRLFWHRAERAVVLSVGGLICLLGINAVARLVIDMITHHHNYSSITLLESATEIWTVNILAFALIYWQLDRAGPAGRASGATGPPDFRFAQEEDDETWRPGFVDYLFVAFAASTSFQPPDHARPVTHRIKLLLMLQESLSLTTLFLIASRAIATLS
jgi:hypothetical protein